MPPPPIRRPALARAACLLTAGLFALAGCGATAAAGGGAGPATADPARDEDEAPCGAEFATDGVADDAGAATGIGP